MHTKFVFLSFHFLSFSYILTTFLTSLSGWKHSTGKCISNVTLSVPQRHWFFLSFFSSIFIHLYLELIQTLILPCKRVLAFSKFSDFKIYFTNYYTYPRHVCTYLKVFCIVTPNLVMKFKNIEIFDIFCEILDLSFAHAFHLTWKCYDQIYNSNLNT